MRTTLLAVATVAVASILLMQLLIEDEAPTSVVALPQDLAAVKLSARESLPTPLAQDQRLRPKVAPVAIEESPEDSAQPVANASDGWLRVAPVPDDEPYLPQLEIDVKAELVAELENLSWTDIYYVMLDQQHGSRGAYIKQVQLERRKGNYDIMSLDGVHGAWGEELLPAHYQGSLWYSFDAKNGTAEIVRLSPVEFRQIYVDRWRVDLARELVKANYNRVPGERLYPRKRPASAAK